MIPRMVHKVRRVAARLQTAVFNIVQAPMLEGRVEILGWPIVSLHEDSSVAIGRGTILVSDSHHTALGLSHPCIIRTISASAVIVIGEHVGISGASICAAESVVIGDGCLLGADVIISDTDFHPVNSFERRYLKTGVATAPVVIGRDVFIGVRAIVLKGASIGDGSVIGAGSVVTGHIPSGVIAAGVPARVLGPITAGVE